MPKRAPPLTRPPPSAAQKPQKRVLMVTTNQENAPENDIADVKALFLTAQEQDEQEIYRGVVHECDRILRTVFETKKVTKEEKADEKKQQKTTDAEEDVEMTEQTIDASEIDAEFYNIYAKALIYLGDAQDDDNTKSQFYEEAKGRLQEAFQVLASLPQNKADSQLDATMNQNIDESLLDDKQKETLIDSSITFAKALTRQVPLLENGHASSLRSAITYSTNAIRTYSNMKEQHSTHDFLIEHLCDIGYCVADFAEGTNTWVTRKEYNLAAVEIFRSILQLDDAIAEAKRGIATAYLSIASWVHDSASEEKECELSIDSSMDYLNKAIEILKSVEKPGEADLVNHLVLLCECHIYLSTLQDEKIPGGEEAEKSYEEAGKLYEQVKAIDPSAIPSEVSELFEDNEDGSESAESHASEHIELQ